MRQIHCCTLLLFTYAARPYNTYLHNHSLALMANSNYPYQDLLERCAQKHSSALKQLYDLEASHFFALGQSLLHRHAEAEEVLRESFVLIWRNANAYDPSLGSAHAWLYSIFRFRALQKRQKNTTLSPLTKAKSQFSIPSNASAELLQFQHLGDAAKRMIALAYLYGFNYAEIAKECQCSIQHAQETLQEGLLRLTHLFTGWHNPSDQHLILLAQRTNCCKPMPQQLKTYCYGKASLAILRIACPH